MQGKERGVIESNTRVGFVGAGKVGTALGELFRSCGIVVSGYSSLLAEDAQAAAEKTASDAYADAAEVVEASDVIFFTVPDGEISNAWKSLVASYGAAACDALFGKIVCHCSGALPAAILADAAEYGAKAASVHPLFAISGGGSAQAKIGTALFTLEGDESALATVSALLDVCGVHYREIASSDKPLYHAAAVCASNLAVGLFASAQTMLERCGFGADEARSALRSLFVGNCESIAERGPIDALTGPIERNDAETVVGHLMAFREDPTLLKERDAYTALSRVVVEVAAAKHPERDYSHIAEILRAAR